jgi:hypothetical protein
MNTRFLPEADTELAEARVWYALQRDGLDVELMRRIDETLRRISDAPKDFHACIVSSGVQSSDNFHSRSSTKCLTMKFLCLQFSTQGAIRSSSHYG